MTDAQNEPNIDEIITNVRNYLEASKTRYEVGTDKYYARRALEAALAAFGKDNYGIGAVAVVQQGKDVHEFLGENAMITGSLGVVDHAETRALIRVAEQGEPDAVYTNEPDPHHDFSIKVFGTLEPCPMCASTLTNSGAVRSVSTRPDGELITEDAGYKVSSGGANVLGDKYPIQPKIWRDIQQGRGLQFELLDDSDQELTSLSWDIFAASRANIDAKLHDRDPVGKWATIRSLYNARTI